MHWQFFSPANLKLCLDWSTQWISNVEIEKRIKSVKNWMNNFNNLKSIEMIPIQWPTTVPKRIYNTAPAKQGTSNYRKVTAGFLTTATTAVETWFSLFIRSSISKKKRISSSIPVSRVSICWKVPSCIKYLLSFFFFFPPRLAIDWTKDPPHYYYYNTT